jgi:glycine cleavage system aminomethyltransferase T
MPWPRRELKTARKQRVSPLYDVLAKDGAQFGQKFGWERANYFAREKGESAEAEQ